MELYPDGAVSRNPVIAHQRTEMKRRTSPHHTEANYERLAVIILPMKTLDEFTKAFPECNNIANQHKADPTVRAGILKQMQRFPKETVDGILDHVCSICGTLMLERTTHVGSLFYWCPTCNEKIHDLFYANAERNGVTVVGQNAAWRIIQTEFRVPEFEEVKRFERKRPPRRYC